VVDLNEGKEPEKTVFIAVKVPPEMKAQMEKLAEAEGVTISDLVRNAIDVFLKKVAEFTPLGSLKLQKIMLGTYVATMWEIYYQRMILFSILQELRKDLTPELKKLFDLTQEQQKRYQQMIHALRQENWQEALLMLLNIWEEEDKRR
jgi:predicted DNA-binding protein